MCVRESGLTGGLRFVSLSDLVHLRGSSSSQFVLGLLAFLHSCAPNGISWWSGRVVPRAIFRHFIAPKSSLRVSWHCSAYRGTSGVLNLCPGLPSLSSIIQYLVYLSAYVFKGHLNLFTNSKSPQIYTCKSNYRTAIHSKLNSNKKTPAILRNEYETASNDVWQLGFCLVYRVRSNAVDILYIHESFLFFG